MGAVMPLWQVLMAFWHRELFRVVLVAVGTSYIATFLTTTKLHRGQTHLAVVYNYWLDWLLRFGLWLFVGVNRAEWAQVHRKHHFYTDIPGWDPHTPLEHGRIRVLLFTTVYYQIATHDPDIRKGEHRLSYDDPVDWWDRHLFKNGFIGLGVSMTLIAMLFTWRFGFGLMAALSPLVWLVAHYAIYLFKGGAVNAGHKKSNEQAMAEGWDRRVGTAANSFKTAWLTVGEWGDHESHHKYPYTVFIGRWYGDLGGIFIWTMIHCGFAHQPAERELTRAEQRIYEVPVLAAA